MCIVENHQDNLIQMSLNELQQRAIYGTSSPRPPRESKQVAHFRSSAIRAYVLRRRAAGSCETCGQPVSFLTEDDCLYLEPHHIRRLSDGGPDHPEWVAGICPNCHRRAHYSSDREEFNARLKDLIQEKKRKLQLDA